MLSISPLTLLLATVLAGPALWRSLVEGDLPLQTALTRFLIAAVVASLMLGVLRRVTDSFGPPAGPDDAAAPAGDLVLSAERADAPRRRSTDT